MRKQAALFEQPSSAVDSSNPPTPLDPYTDAPAYTTVETAKDPVRYTVSLTHLGDIQLWNLDQPRLYTVHVRLSRAGQVIDQDTRRVGFREATFTDHGFSLNGKIVKLRGLDRHQTFPFVGQAMPARVQRQDADILRKGSIATSFAHPIILSPAISSIGATRSACWCWRRFPAGSISARKMEASGDRQRWPHDSPRLEPPLHHPLGSPHQ